MSLTYVPKTRTYLERLIDDGSQFLGDLEKKLRPIGLKDRETLLTLKKEEHEEKGYPFDGEFYIWDYRYYDRKFIEKSLDLDDSLVKEYFPVTVVVPAILDIYQRLLSVRFVPLESATWHPGVSERSSEKPYRSTHMHRCQSVLGVEGRCERRIRLRGVYVFRPVSSRYVCINCGMGAHPIHD
jgi:hypothetical protein